MPTNEQKILNALYFCKIRHNMDEVPQKRILGMVTGMSKATYAPLVSRMKTKKIVAGGAGNLSLTEAGLSRVDTTEVGEMPSSNEEVHQQIASELKGQKVKDIFLSLTDGKAHKKESIMKAVGISNPKTFSPLVSRSLAKLGYVHYPTKGEMRLTDSCFPFGRPE